MSILIRLLACLVQVLKLYLILAHTETGLEGMLRYKQKNLVP